MVRKIRAKLILQLRNHGLSRRANESAQGISRHSIQAALDAAEQLGLGWDDLAKLLEAEVYAALYPGRGVRESVFAQPDWCWASPGLTTHASSPVTTGFSAP